MSEHKISVSKTAHYSILEPDTFMENRKVWLVFHGYGQLAKYFIQKFQSLLEFGDTVVAVEGLSRAYINGFTGRVGASWMTKEDREDEIEDYMAYLDKVYNIVAEQFNCSKVMVLGFSQGTATASRWAFKRMECVEELLLWCGEPAKELLEHPSFHKIKTKLFIGENDHFINEKSLENSMWKNNLGKNFQIYYFQGGHDIDQCTLLDFRRKFQ